MYAEILYGFMYRTGPHCQHPNIASNINHYLLEDPDRVIYIDEHDERVIYSFDEVKNLMKTLPELANRVRLQVKEMTKSSKTKDRFLAMFNEVERMEKELDLMIKLHRTSDKNTKASISDDYVPKSRANPLRLLIDGKEVLSEDFFFYKTEALHTMLGTVFGSIDENDGHIASKIKDIIDQRKDERICADQSRLEKIVTSYSLLNPDVKESD